MHRHTDCVRATHGGRPSHPAPLFSAKSACCSSAVRSAHSHKCTAGTAAGGTHLDARVAPHVDGLQRAQLCQAWRELVHAAVLQCAREGSGGCRRLRPAVSHGALGPADAAACQLNAFGRRGMALLNAPNCPLRPRKRRGVLNCCPPKSRTGRMAQAGQPAWGVEEHAWRERCLRAGRAGSVASMPRLLFSSSRDSWGSAACGSGCTDAWGF